MRRYFLLLVFCVLGFPFLSAAATFHWTQTDWSGGSTTAATATSSQNKTNWTKFYSSDSGVVASSSVSLGSAAGTTYTQTSDADFNAGTQSSTQVSGGSVSLTSSFLPKTTVDWASRVVGSVASSTVNINQAVSKGNYLYTFTDTTGGGMAIWDNTNPASPVYLKTVLNGTVYSVRNEKSPYVVGNFIYGAKNPQTNYTYTLINITDPLNPKIDASLPQVSSQDEFRFYNNLGLISAGSNGGLTIYDVSSSTNPVLKSTLPSAGSVMGTVATGTYAYSATDGTGLKVINISDPTNPSVVTSVNATDHYQGLVLNGRYIYASKTVNSSRYVTVFDLANPASPVQVGEVSAVDYTPQMDVVGNYLFLHISSGVSVYNISNPTTPVSVSDYTPAAPLYNSIGGFATSTYEYTVVWQSGVDGNKNWLNIYNTADLALTPASIYNTSINPTAMQVSGNYGFVADKNYGLRVLNISNPASMSLAGSLSLGANTYTVALAGNYAYIGQDVNLRVVDITDPTNPILRGTYTGTSSVLDVKVSGNYAYIANDVAGVKSINISSSTAPTLASSYYPAGTNVHVTGLDFIDSTYLVLAEGANTGSGIETMDYSNPASITHVSGVASESAFRYTYGIKVVSGKYVYMPIVYPPFPSGGANIYAFDVTNPASPAGMSPSFTISTNTVVRNLDASGKYLFFSEIGPSGKLRVYDNTTPASPTLVSSYGFGGTTGSSTVNVAGANVYVSDTVNGLYTFPVFSFATVGTFTSSIIDTGAGAHSDLGPFSWTGSLPTGAALSVKVRSSTSASMTGATAFASCPNITNGQDLTGSGCVTDSDRYLQYQVTLSSSGMNSPTLDSTSFTANTQTLVQTLTSSPFNTEDPTSVIANLTWTGTVPAGTNLQFQLRTAPNNGGVPGTWTSWLGPTGTGDYYTVSSGNTINSTLHDGSADQWVQYKAFLTYSSDYSAKPLLAGADITYVVNVAPEFQAAPVIAYANNGIVDINYAVRDTDTASTTGCPGCVIPTFEYSTNGGSSWAAISGLAATSTASTTVATSSYNSYNVAWNAKTQLSGNYYSGLTVRVTVNDKEGANNTAVSTSNSIALDVKNPVLGSPALKVSATTSPAFLNLSASDDSPLQMCITLDGSQNNCTAYNATSSIALTGTNNTVTVIFKDSFGNTSTASVAVPQAPANMMVRDASAAPNYMELVAWQAAIGSFGKYEVWNSTDGANYRLLASVTDRNTNYYLDNNLSNSNTYYYKTDLVDANGNTSPYSDVVSDVPNGTVDASSTPDHTPPVISGVGTGVVSNTAASINWTTDEPANSIVYFGTTTKVYTGTTSSATLTTTHAVNLSSLATSTTYYYYVSSADAAGNLATSTEYSFTTANTGYVPPDTQAPVLGSIGTGVVSNTVASINWTTDEPATSIVYYGSTTKNYTASTSSLTLTSSHSLTLSNLATGTTYYYSVASTDASGNATSSTEYSFTTSNIGVASPDLTPPVVSNVHPDLVTNNAASIGWSTDENADSLVEYGTVAGNYTWSKADTTLTTTHALTLTGLATGTIYYYRVTSKDASLNSTSSTEYSVATTNTGVSAPDVTAPVISQTGESAVTNSSAVIGWVTDEPAASLVAYGTSSGNYLATVANPLLSTLHSLALTPLASSTTYYYVTVSADAAGNISTSTEHSFVTTAVYDQSAVNAAHDAGVAEGKASAPVYSGGGGGGATIDSFSIEQLLQAINNYTKKLKPEDRAAALQIIVDRISQALQNLADGTGSLEANLNTLLSDLSNNMTPPIFSSEPKVTVTADSATIEWQTDKEANSLVAIAPRTVVAVASNAPIAPAELKVVTGNPNDKATVHTVTLTNLKPDTFYRYQVRSITPLGKEVRSNEYVFKTKAQSNEISTYSVKSISKDKYLFSWATSGDSDSTVKLIPYRQGQMHPDEALVGSDGIPTTMHGVEVSGIQPGVSYNVQLSSKDARGQIASKQINGFSTTNTNVPPQITQVQTDSAMTSGKGAGIQTVISWGTNVPADGVVYYQSGLGKVNDKAWQSSAADSNFTTNHVAVITKFKPGSVYRFKIASTDSAGKKVESKVYTLLTPKQKETVFTMIINNFQDIFGWTKKI